MSQIRFMKVKTYYQLKKFLTPAKILFYVSSLFLILIFYKYLSFRFPALSDPNSADQFILGENSDFQSNRKGSASTLKKIPKYNYVVGLGFNSVIALKGCYTATEFYEQLATFPYFSNKTVVWKIGDLLTHRGASLFKDCATLCQGWMTS